MLKSFLSVFLSVCILSALFCVPVNAAEPTQIILTGDALYNLLSTGEWTAVYVSGDTSASVSSISLDTSNNFVVLSGYPNSIVSYDLNGGSVMVDFGVDYGGCTSVSVELGGVYVYYNLQNASSNYQSFDQLSGIVHGSTDLYMNKGSNNGSVTYEAKYLNRNNGGELTGTFTANVLTGASSFVAQPVSGVTLIGGTSIDLSSYDYNFLGISMAVKSVTFTYDSDASADESLDKLSTQLDETNTKLQKISDNMGVMTYVMGQLNNELKDKITEQIEQDKQNTQDIIDNQEENTQEIIDNQDQNTQDIIDNDDKLWSDTYDPSEEDVADMQDGINDMTDELKDKLGLFTFIDDTLSQFFSLLDPKQVSSTNMVFPSLSITVQGQSYEFVKQTEYDISSLVEIEGFEPLFTALHFFSVAIIYWALIDYLQKVFKRIFASGSGEEQ